MARKIKGFITQKWHDRLLREERRLRLDIIEQLRRAWRRQNITKRNFLKVIEREKKENWDLHHDLYRLRSKLCWRNHEIEELTHELEMKPNVGVFLEKTKEEDFLVLGIKIRKQTFTEAPYTGRSRIGIAANLIKQNVIGLLKRMVDKEDASERTQEVASIQ